MQFLAGAIGGGLLTGFVLARLGTESIPQLLAFLAMSLALLWLQVVLHEVGHAVAGLAAGRRLLAMGIGPLRLENGGDGLRLRWAHGVRGISGFAALLPGDGRGASRAAHAAYLLGGPLANLAAAAAGFALLSLAQPTSIVAVAALWAVVATGGFIGLINLVPFRSHGWSSDGLGLLGLVRNTPEYRISAMQQQVVSLAVAGVRPRDWPLESLQIPDDAPEAQATIAHVLKLDWALDRNDTASSEAEARALAAAYPAAPAARRPGIALMLAKYAVIGVQDAALLAAWRPLCERSLLDTSAFCHWLDAEAALMHGDGAAARWCAAQARVALGRVHDAASVIVLRERLQMLDERLAHLQPPAAVAAGEHHAEDARDPSP